MEQGSHVKKQIAKIERRTSSQNADSDKFKNGSNVDPSNVTGQSTDTESNAGVEDGNATENSEILESGTSERTDSLTSMNQDNPRISVQSDTKNESQQDGMGTLEIPNGSGTSETVDSSTRNSKNAETEPYLVISGEEEDKRSAFRSPKALLSKAIAFFMASKTLKDVLQNYKLELTESKNSDFAKLIWQGSPSTMFNFQLTNLSSTGNVRRHNGTANVAEFPNLELGTSYKLEVTSKFKQEEKRADLTFSTRPKPVSDIRLEGDNLQWAKAIGAETLSVLVTIGEEKKTEQLPGSDCTMDIDDLEMGKEIHVEINAIAKDSRSFSKCSKSLRVGGNTVPYDVTAIRSEDNPCRNVVVSWHPPDDYTQVKSYIVKIKSKGQNNFKLQKETQNNSFTFENLMSNSRYICTVQAKDFRGALSGKSKSQVVRTENKIRQRVVISKLGKPRRFAKELVYDQIVRCRMSWTPAELGNHADDFERKDMKMKITEMSSQNACRQLKNDEFAFDMNSAEASLKWGLEYKVQLIALFRDLDTLEETEAILEEVFAIDCEKVAKIDIDERNDGKVIISWPAARGAANYLVTVHSNTSGVVSPPKFQKETSCVLQTGFGLSNGKEYEFVVDSFNVANEKKTKRETRFLGCSAPTNLSLQICQDDPHRSLSLAWSKPNKHSPAEYEYQLFDKENESVQEPMRTKERSVTIQWLKQGCSYYACVRAIYQNKPGLSAYSTATSTKSGLKLQQIDLDDWLRQGGVRKFDIIPCSKKLDETEIIVKWERPTPPPELLRHFRLHKVLLEITNLSNLEVLLQEQQPPQSDKKLTLPGGGKFLLRITVHYQNIDEDYSKQAVQDRTFETDIEQPDIATPSFNAGIMQLTWKSCASCTRFKWKIKHPDSLEVYESGETSERSLKLRTKQNYRNGKICCFEITAIAPNGKEMSATSEDVVIGGKYVPYDVVCLKSATNPRRSLDVRWKMPQGCQPTEYVVKLFEKGLEKAVDKKVTKETQTQFIHLKSGTSYFAAVRGVTNAKPNGTSESDLVTTDRALKATPLKDLKFPSKIHHDSTNRSSKVTIYWKETKFEEVFRIQRYEIEVSYKNLINITKCMQKQTVQYTDSKDDRTVTFCNLKPNVSYCATVTAVVKNLDTGEFREVEGKHAFRLSFAKPSMHPIKQDGEVITLSWNEIEGGVFDIEIKDAQTQECLKSFAGQKKNKISFGLDNDKLRTGRRCKITLLVRSEQDDGTNPEQQIQDWIIGGKNVPIDVAASNNPEKPHRSINIQFNTPDCPEKPERYKIFAHPKEGPTRICETTATLVKFPHLQSGMLYQFEVAAIFKEGKESRKSLSQKIRTGRSPSHSPETVLNVAAPNVTLENISASANVFMQQIPGFDVVDEPNVKYRVTESDLDAVTVYWRPPLFGNDQDNFVVKFYELSIATFEGSSVFEEEFPATDGVVEFTSPEVSLNLGRKYNIMVFCEYDNIDQRKDRCKSQEWRYEYQARPCKPNITTNRCNEESRVIELEWSCSDGAEKYKVEVFSDEQTLAMSDETSSTRWSREFNDLCSFGSTYSVKITAKNGEKENWRQSGSQIIGGNMVPRKATASRDAKDATTTANLTWVEPQEQPDYYLIVIIDKSTKNEMVGMSFREWVHANGERSDSTEKQVSGLNPGSCYRFKIHAVHGDKVSGGCLTNEIETKPGPGKVGNVETSLNVVDGSTKIDVRWKKEENCSAYKITLIREYMVHSTRIEEWSNQTFCTIGGLIPGGTYRVFVTGRSSDGSCGNPSEQTRITTNYDSPKCVKLTLEDDNPQCKVTVRFDEAQGPPKRYRVTLVEHETKGVFKKMLVESNEASFHGLSTNTVYQATVKAEYHEEDAEPLLGKSMESNTVITAPDRPEITNISQHHCPGDINTIKLKVEWRNDPGCSRHQVSVSKGYDEEMLAVVKTASSWEYHPVVQEGELIVKVRSMNGSKYYGEWSKEYRVTLVPRPPSKVKAEISENGQIRVSWEKPRLEVKDYIVTTICNEIVKNCQHVDTQEFTIANPTPASTYRFHVAAVGIMPSRETTSNIVYSRPKKCPMPEVKLQAPRTLEISWDKIQKCSYEMKISKLKNIGGGCPVEEAVISLNSNENLHKYSCCELGTLYQINMRAMYETTPGEWSDAKKIFTAPNGAKNLELKAIRNNETKQPAIRVSWKQPEPHPQEYHVQFFIYDVMKGEREKFGEIRKPKVSTESEMSYQLKHLPFNKAYSCELIAVTDGAESIKAVSDVAFVPLEKPSSLFVRPDGKDPSHAAHFAWRMENDFADSMSFKLIISCEGAVKNDVKLAETKYHMTDGEPGVTYEVKLHWGVDKTYSDQYLGTTFTLAPPIVKNLQIRNIGDRKLKLSWDKISPRPKSYQVLWQEDGKEVEKEVPGDGESIFIDAGPGCEVVAKVAAVNESGMGAFSETCKCCIAPIRPLSINVGVPKENPDTSLLLYVEDCNEFEKKYIFSAVQENGDQAPITRTVMAKSCLLTGLKPGLAYLVSVQSEIRGIKSEKISYVEPVRTMPSKLNKPTANTNSSELKFGWECPDYAVKFYFVELRKDDETAEEFTSDTNYFTIHDPRPSSYYSIRVAAGNSSGLGELSEWEKILTEPAPPRIKSVKSRCDGEKRSFIVCLEDENTDDKLYKVIAVPVANGDEKHVETKEKQVQIKGLLAATKYRVYAQTIFHGKHSKRSKYNGNLHGDSMA